jgi:diadenosine tetraphosphate (Ap4A) HIT family hydrolase
MTATTTLHETFEQALRLNSGCLFCKPYESMVIHESQSFRVLIDTFPIIPGHLMISSKAHYGSAGEIPVELQEELFTLKEDLKNRVRTLNGNCIFYEHGRAGCCMKTNPNGQKCEHFHLHCLPVEACILTELSKKFKAIAITDYSDVMNLFMQYGNYLYFENSQSQQFFFPASDNEVESHLLRTLICDALQVSKRSNWEGYRELDTYIESQQLIETNFYKK